ncbi:FadR/GntR family transcriptional regulator [Marinobacterium sp. xm-d-564]|uniref:FadR/GntR family transcriptional regulator n=1 Tax=Marinobacterium sp. xm-d-564 TaxID=2497742 RepID=UPI002112E2EF|nr:FCD domain-containing protein [Marinobacterium sp. xm-d-564]
MDTTRAGETLPSESRLAAHFSVSRSAIREAMSELLAAGLLIKQQGRLTRLVNPLESVVLNLPVKADPTLNDVRDVLELRAFIESVAAGCCAENASKTQIAIIRSEFEKMQLRSQKNTTLIRAKADLQFHMLIAKYSHNLVVASLSELFYNRYFSSIYKALDLTLKRYGRYPERINPQHQQIFSALEQGDRLAAQEAAREHVLYTRSLLAFARQ